MASRSVVNISSGNGLVPDGTKPFAEPAPTYHRWWLYISKIQTFHLMKQELGLGLYSVTNCAGNILWRFTKITSSGNILHYSHYKQYAYAITKKQKKWGKIILCKESDNIAAVTSIWRVFFQIDRELVVMALDQALSKWSVTIVTLRPCKTHSFKDSVILLHEQRCCLSQSSWYHWTTLKQNCITINIQLSYFTMTF